MSGEGRPRPPCRYRLYDLVLELAVAAGCDAIVTFNRRDFAGAERFGLRIRSPGEFLGDIGDRP